MWVVHTQHRHTRGYRTPVAGSNDGENERECRNGPQALQFGEATDVRKHRARGFGAARAPARDVESAGVFGL